MNKRKLLQIARDTGKELKKLASTDYLDHFAVVYSDGQVEMFDNQPCYAQFMHKRNVRKVGDLKPVYFVTWHLDKLYGHSLKDDVQRRFYHWVFNKSPYAKAYVTKDCRRVLTEPTIISCDFPPQFVIAAAILVRYRSEYTKFITNWDLLVKGGMHRNLAMVMMHQINPISSNSFEYNGAFNNGHSCMDCFGPTRITSFFKGTPALDVKKKVSEWNFNYRDIDSVWGKADNPKHPEPKHHYWQKAYWGDGKVKVLTNLFSRAKEFQEDFLKINNLEGLLPA